MQETAIAVDWSGARTGERAKLWLAEASGGRLLRLEAGRDRAQLVEHLIDRAGEVPELIVGFDFSFSFPAWFCRELGVNDAFELWERIEREGERWIAACPPPFWGRRGTRRPVPDSGRPLFRRTESARLPLRGIHPKSTFQLAGPGSVGVGTLRGVPFLRLLRERGFAVWPFDAPRRPLVVEIYPRWLTGPVRKSNASARRLFVSTRLADQASELVERAAGSEDAFDAAVSALRMSRHAPTFQRLPPVEDPLERLEGCIWRPLADPFLPGPGSASETWTRA